jgi:cytochrome c(L)
MVYHWWLLKRLQVKRKEQRLRAKDPSIKRALMVTKGPLSHGLFCLLIAGLFLVPLARVRAEEAVTPQKLNPYTGNAEAIQQGKALYLQMGCSGCHGVGGGGGMGPALLDDEWKFGSDDATLFKLIKGEVPQQTMPATIGNALKDDEIWKIIAYVRSLYHGDPSKINW